MWSSRLQPSSASAAKSKVDFSRPAWTEVAAHTLPQPIPVLEDGSLELDAATHTKTERVVPVPLQFSALSLPKDGTTAGSESQRETVRVYVDQQGHTVKLAHLDAPPSVYPVTTRVSKNHVSSHKRNVRPGQTAQVSQAKSSAASGDHLPEQDALVNLDAEVSSSKSIKNSMLGRSSMPTKLNKVNSNPQKPKMKTQLKNRLNVTEHVGSNSIVRFGTSSDEVERPKHPSLFKDELSSGLRRIMTDLATLDLPTQSHNVVESDNICVKEPCHIEADLTNIGNGKENDFPGEHHHLNRSVIGDSYIHNEVPIKKPLPVPRSNKSSLSDVADTFKSGKADSKRSSTSSLSSVHRTSGNFEAADLNTRSSQERKKSYDREKAIQYMYQQKQERRNRVKSERKQQQANVQARKQKLDELRRISSQLVQASIKRKPNSLDGKASDDKLIQPEKDLSGPKPIKEPMKNVIENSNTAEVPKESMKDPIHTTLNQYSGSSIPVSLDDSNAQLIKDICEMKNKIEAISKSLKTTIESSRSGPIQLLSTARMASAPSDLAALINHHDELEHLPNQGYGGISVSAESTLKDSTSHPPYIDSLTSNLKKIRESLQSVLSESEVKSCVSSSKSRSSRAHSGHFRHRRFSSADSDSAFEVMRQEGKNFRALPFGSDVPSNLQKKKITTSFPTLPIAGAQNVAFDRKQYQRPSSAMEVDSRATILNPAVNSTSTNAVSEEHGNSFSSKQDENFENGGQIDWLDSFSSRPYPINVLSALKRKLVGSLKCDESGRMKVCKVEPSPVTSKKQEAESLQSASQHSSAATPLTLPPFITIRGMPSLDLKTGSWSSMLNSRPTSKVETSAVKDDEPPVFGSNIFINKMNGNSSILDALNLEKMQAEFTEALNPLTVNSSDVIPAEKPLSAPNTPAKTSLKLERPPSLSKAERHKLESESLHERKRSIHTVTEVPRPEDLENLDHGVLATVADGNNHLVPPNVHLASCRLEKQPGGADGWVSHGRGSGKSAISANEKEEASSSTQVSSSSRDTFEVGHVFNPTSLHLQFQAELNLLDSYFECLSQISEVDKVREVALARHEACLEPPSLTIPKEDKAIDVQTSLLQSEVSSVNYKRGSGNPNDITLLNIDPQDVSREKKSSSCLPVRDEHLSSSSTLVSDTLGSSTKEKVPDFGLIPSTAEEKASNTGVNSISTEIKSISEDIYTMSDSVPEEITSKLEGAQSHSINSKNDKLQDKFSSKNFNLMKNSKAENVNRFDQSVMVDLSAKSMKNDSTFADDTLIFNSFQYADHSMFPTLVSGEDMFQFNLQMLEQLMHEEELRVQHRNTLLKLRVKVMGEMARTEVAALDLEKKKLREKGEGHKDLLTALRKKQRGIMLRFQQQREEIERVRRTEELAWQERRLMYLQQMHLIRMQISAHSRWHTHEKCGGNTAKKGRVKSLQENRINNKGLQKTSAPETSNIPSEVPTVTHSSSISMASLASEVSKSSVVSNSSRKVIGGVSSGIGAGDTNGGAGGDSESSHLEERVLKGLNELESRCRNLKEREKVLHERRQSVEQIIQWRRKLEEEERYLRDVERQAHSRHRTAVGKHSLRDRSTSPFQFAENSTSGSTVNGSNGSAMRSMTEISRNSRSNAVNNSASASGSPNATEDMDSSIPEEITEHNNKPSGESTMDGTIAEQYANESFESEVSEIKTQESQMALQEGPQGQLKEQFAKPPLKVETDCDAKLPKMSERSNKYPGVTIKVPLSPRLQRVQRRRYSSGSDDSMVLSQTETGSEQSDIEGRISALSEQLHQCKAEAERLRKEAKRTRNERLIAKEQSLHKQLQAYESYISQLRRNLEAELKQSSVPIVRPQIKQPRVSTGKVASRRQDADVASTPGTDRSALQTASSEAASASLLRNEIETELREAETVSESVSTVVSEGASEIASEAASEVPSEGPSEVPSDVASEAASEVSENSSLLSQDAPSLVANRVVKEVCTEAESASIGRQREKEVVSDCETDVLSAVKSVEHADISQSHGEPQDQREEQDLRGHELLLSLSSHEPETSIGTVHSQQTDTYKNRDIEEVRDHKNEHVFDGEVYVTSEKKDEIASTSNTDDVTASIDQVKSITSEEDFDDASVTLEEDLEVSAQKKVESDVIRVFVREKEKETHDSDVEDAVPAHYDLECNREKVVDSITNDLLQSLLNECLRTAVTTHSPSQDAVWNAVVSASVQEATAHIMSIYKKRMQMQCAQSKDVRRRVNEILAETNASSKLRAEGRIKEMMTTTYGVLSPEDSPCGSPSLSSSPVQQIPLIVANEDADTTYNKMAETSALKSNIGKASDAPMGLVGENVVDSEGFSQEWFDEDFGLTRSRREAEELRRQQLQIEHEIEQLQQQQAQVQEQIPYYYVREIPNKPPPPYTPPGQAPRLLASSASLATAVEEVRSVCSDRPVILKTVASAVDFLYKARSQGLELEIQEPPSSFLDVDFTPPPNAQLSDQDLATYKNNAKVYKMFLFDLAKELVLNAYNSEADDPSPPWLRPENWVRRRKALTVVPKTKEMLHDTVSRQVLVLFGFVPKASKENLTIRWSRKKRDHVDELLVRESQEEERQWTNYEQDEAVVKNNVTLAILDSLLDDTVQVLGDVFRRREQRQHCSAY